MEMEATLSTHGRDGTALAGDLIVAVPDERWNFLVGSTVIETSTRMGVTHLTVKRGPGFLLPEIGAGIWQDCIGLTRLTVERM